MNTYARLSARRGDMKVFVFVPSVTMKRYIHYIQIRSQFLFFYKQQPFEHATDVGETNTL